MRSYLRIGISACLLSLLTACASMPSGQSASGTGVPANNFKEKPGDVTFGSDEADLIYKLLVAELATQRGMTDVAVSFYVDAARESRDPEVAARAVRVASFANAKEDALDAAMIWAEQEPDNIEAQRVLAVLLLRNNRYDEAVQQLQRLLASDNEGIGRNFMHIGAILQREVGKEPARDIVQRLISSHPDVAEAHYVAATMALSVSENQEAMFHIDQTLELRPGWVDAVLLRSRVLQEISGVDEALKYLKAFLDANPENDMVRLSYARSLVDARELEEARSQFELLAVKMPSNVDVLFALGMLSMQFKELDEAEGYLLQLYKLGKRDAQVLYYLGQIAEQQQNDEQALDWYSKVHRSEYYLDAQLRIAAVLARSKSLEDAQAHLHSLHIESMDDKREVILFEGTLLRNERLYRAAYDLFSAALREMPKDIELLYARALVAERVNRVDIAVEDLEYVISQQPDNAAALNALGYTLADRTDRHEEALGYIEQAIEIEPEDPAIMDSMGWVQYRLGNLDKALEYLRKAREKINDGEVAAHLGEVLWVSGSKAEAKKIWEEAKEKDAENEILLKTMQRFLK